MIDLLISLLYAYPYQSSFSWFRNINIINFIITNIYPRSKKTGLKEGVKQLIDIKFNAPNENGPDEYTAPIIYEENMNPGRILKCTSILEIHVSH